MASLPASGRTLSAWAPALRSRNFRLFWFGQLISTAGTALQVVAEGYLIYQITGSTFWLGMVGLLALLPVVPVSFMGGLLIDRVPRRKLLLATQGCLMLQAAVFGLLVLSGRLQLWHIIVLYSIFGALLAIDHPARRAFLVELVEPGDLANAVGLNAVLFNVSSLVGYAVAGLLIAAVGAGVTMMVNSVTYLAPIVALSLIRVADVAAERHQSGQPRQPFFTALMQGIVAVWQQPTILGAISLMAVVGGLAWPVFGMMPAYAEEVLQVGAVGLGILLASGALGSVAGTVAVARLGAHRRGATLTLVSFGLPPLIVAFAFAQSLLWACLVLVLVGALLLILQSLAITLVQLNIDDRVRGRVMSLYSQIHAGADTLSNVAIGSLAVAVGLPTALAMGGMAALAYAGALRWRMPSVRRLD